MKNDPRELSESVNTFHRHYEEAQLSVNTFHRHYEEAQLWRKTKWLGQPMWKLPFDAMVLQDIICETRPELIIETGTGLGGSALFYASIMELLDIENGKVLTIDIEERFDGFKDCPAAKRISRLIGSSTSYKIASEAALAATGKRCMVILDSWHSYDHVCDELLLYYNLVSEGCYLVVEDSHVSGHPVEWQWGKGPFEAIEWFLSEEYGKSFAVDYSRECYLMTFNPMGYLVRNSL